MSAWALVPELEAERVTEALKSRVTGEVLPHIDSICTAAVAINNFSRHVQEQFERGEGMGVSQFQSVISNAVTLIDSIQEVSPPEAQRLFLNTELWRFRFSLQTSAGIVDSAWSIRRETPESSKLFRDTENLIGAQSTAVGDAAKRYLTVLFHVLGPVQGR